LRWSTDSGIRLLQVLVWSVAGLVPPASAQRSAAPRNIIFILSDDHRYDFLGFMSAAPEWLETPNFDRMAQQGAHLRHAFVTTALCSPSRASILTGKYAHKHGVVDNTTPVPSSTVFFPQLLQKSGYHTAYLGKWHMGEATASDDPRPGFHHWISFQGQGVYTDPMLNVNGRRAQAKGYTTDLLTDSALGWLERQPRNRPFFLYLSHKGVHAEFVPAERHRGRYAGQTIPYPATMANTERNYRGKPRWMREQRDSWHGVDYAYHGAMDFDEFYRRYAETLLAVDESVGRVLDYLIRSKLSQSTLVIYMSDNGFSLGEHGLIDKRHAYEESIRVPMLAWAPGFIARGLQVTDLVRNIDVAPTLLDLAGVDQPEDMDGRSVLGALAGRAGLKPVELLYEYYWEYAFPQTPTVFALRDERYKYIYYHGVWDVNELYDLKTDSLELHNLIDIPALQPRVREMRDRLFDQLQATDGMQIPLRRGDWQAADRKERP
jgi:N-acetylglucosamine-6-sulfatase